MSRARAESPGERGAALILALVFVAAIGLIIGALVGLSGTSMTSTAHLQILRAQQYAADGALDVGVQTLRYDSSADAAESCFTNGGTPGGPVASMTLNGQSVAVWCQAASLPGTPTPGRQVSFCALSASSPTPASWSACLGSAISQATVLYGDLKPQCASDCAQPGTTLVVEDWTVNLANS